jgi:hypothetical protein
VGNHEQCSIEAKLPNPIVLACEKPLPLSLLVKRESGSSEPVQIDFLEITLNSITVAKVKGVQKVTKTIITILSDARATYIIPTEQDRLFLDFGEACPQSSGAVPITVPLVIPSFCTCNIERSYELNIGIKVTMGTLGTADVVRVSTAAQIVRALDVAMGDCSHAEEDLPLYDNNMVTVHSDNESS